VTVLSTKARRCAEAWQAWIDDPDHNPPPNPKASTRRLLAYMAFARHREYMTRYYRRGESRSEENQGEPTWA
jgi:hypothetical protein